MQRLFIYLAWLIAPFGWSCSQAPPLRQNWDRNQGVEALLRLQENQFANLEDLRAEARITLNQAGRKQQATASILYKSPDRLRFEVRGPLFTHIFTALLEGDSLLVYDRSATLKGAVHGPMLANMIGVDLGVYDLRYAILGLVEPGVVTGVQIEQNPRADRQVYVLAGESGQRQVWVDLFAGFFLREELAVEGSPAPVERRLEDYRQVAGVFFPSKISFRQGEMEFSLDYKNYTINEGIADKLFIQGIPKRPILRY